MNKDIKDYREKELNNFVMGNILLVLFGTRLIDKVMLAINETTAWGSINALLTSALFSSMMYIFVFVADSVVPAGFKECMVWLKTGKPGENIFDQIQKNNKDDRYTSEEAMHQYADVYKQLKSNNEESNRIQNSAWYKIYKRHEDHIQILTSQRDYLLCRDMCVMTIYMFIAYFILQLYRMEWVSLKMFMIFAEEYLILLLAARLKGDRFVRNVIAVDIAKNKKEKEETKIVM